MRANGAGERRRFCGRGRHTWLATEAETGGAYLLFEDALDARKVTPLHQHPDADETFYMLEGEVRLHVAGDEQTLAAGGIAIIPRGVPHAFMETTPTARMLRLQTPGGGETFYRHASEPAGAGEPPPPGFGRVPCGSCCHRCNRDSGPSTVLTAVHHAAVSA